jgi:predicted nucleotide-binding protein
MLERFSSEANLVEALREQSAVAHDRQLAERLAKLAHVEEHPPGAVIIEVEKSDREIYFVLAGRVAIEIRGQRIATRGPGQHFGEMAMIDLTARRSATVRALEKTVTARVSEPHFTAVAAQHQQLWRFLALELCKRLRERGGPRPSNERTEVFIGSTEGQLEIARALQSSCAREDWVTRTWADGAFGAGKTPVESLTAQLERLDFGLFVVAADDLTGKRGGVASTPRDDVIFELGLLAGALGRERTFMVRVRSETSPGLSFDLPGVTALEIAGGRRDDLAARVVPAMARFREIVWKLGPR